MLQYNPTISGSLNITGSLIISNGMIGTVNGVDVQIFSSSISQVVTNIQTTTGSQSGRLTSIESFTSSTSARLGSIETISASNLSRINSIETITSSNIARLNAVETITASNIARLTSLEITTGSLATTGSNTFIGTQTITGSLFISSNLVVQGTSSLQNITASAVSIGTNIVNLNTANPAIRYAGLSIGDSGSIGGSGSFLYDSVQDEMIFVHRGTSTVVTSSVTLMGPQTYDNVGNETYPTLNIIQKGTGNEHLGDSCIFDDGTTTCIKNNLVGTGTACFAGAVCTPTIQSANVCTDGSYGSRVVAYGSNVGMFVNATGAGEGYYRILNGACSIGALAATGWYKGSAEQNMGIITGPSKSFQIATNDCANARLTIGADGISVFACQVCIPTLVVTNCINVGTISSLGSMLSIQSPNDQAGITMYNTYDCNKWSLRTGTVGVSNKGFAIVDDICNITRIQINGAGYVGIGTCVPNNTLQVVNSQINGGFYNTNICGDSIGMIPFQRNNGSDFFGLSRNGQMSIFAFPSCSNVFSIGTQNASDMIFGTNGVERMRIHSSGITKFNYGGAITIIAQKNYSVGAGATVNVCFDIQNEFSVAVGYMLNIDIQAGGYGSAGSSGLVYNAKIGGYNGHYVGLGSYHQFAEPVKCTSGVTVSLYNPSANLLGITIVNGSGSYPHTGNLRMIMTYG